MLNKRGKKGSLEREDSGGGGELLTSTPLNAGYPLLFKDE
jgi:hypothetical protein